MPASYRAGTAGAGPYHTGQVALPFVRLLARVAEAGLLHCQWYSFSLYLGMDDFT